MPVNGAHVLDSGGERDQIVVAVPGRIRAWRGLLGPALCDLGNRMPLRIRKEPYKEKEKKEQLV